jgi:hypothetical protein
LEKVNVLYTDAKAKRIHDEIIKALLYRLSLEEKVKDDDINKNGFDAYSRTAKHK